MAILVSHGWRSSRAATRGKRAIERKMMRL